jgi:hypothetical protein
MNPWISRTESSAIASMRQCPSPTVAAAAERGTVSIATTVILISFSRRAAWHLRMLSVRICVIEAGPL